MEERKSVDFVRLLSDESSQSTLSEELCAYHQTEIFDQLPSSQAARAQCRQGDQETRETREGDTEPDEKLQHHVPLSRGAKASSQPLRNLPMCIQGKREARDRRELQSHSIGYWESWRRSQSINSKRVWAHVGGAIVGLLPWKHVLHTIEGRFGVGVKAYFVFLRYLVYLNLLHCLIIGASILGPTAFYGGGNISDPLSFTGNDSVLDFFLGTGFLERSPVFYGFYTRGSLNLPCLNTPLLFLVGIITIFIISLILVVRRTAVGYKHTWLLGKRHSFNVSYKIFCGWDFTIQDPGATRLKQSFIRNDLKLYLEEQRFHLREAQRTVAQWVRLYLLRISLNFLVLTLLGGAFCLIYFATMKSQAAAERSGVYWLLSLFLQYLPPIVITVVNLILPHIFRKISAFEDYSLTTQVNATLVRSIFLKLASLGIYLLFLFRTNQQKGRCWENQFGKEMYKLWMFDFLSTFCNTFLYVYPRMLLAKKFPSSRLGRLSGQQLFLIPFNVLDLVYNQTVSWVGVYYCPLLPLIGTVKLVAIFYIKKFTVMRCCVPEQRMFRASSSSVLFHFMLLLGLIMAAATLGISLLEFSIVPSPASLCGPFGGRASVFNVTGVCVGSLPGPAQSTLRYLASEAFVLPLILAEIVILTSYVSRGRANQKAMERLEDMLVMCSSDKRFLVKQHTTMLRRRKKLQKDLTAGTKEDSLVSQQKDPPPTI